MNTLNTIKTADLSRLDPRGGVLVYTTYWRPEESAPDPEHPGLKMTALSYLPVAPEELCPCGSGHLFESCCQPLPYWQPVCPNPGLQGHQLMEPQAAHFSNVSIDAVYDFLQQEKDDQLYCVQDDKPHAFWILWGDPALEAPPYGVICFGDIELQEDRTLLVTALSKKRMETLLDLLRPLNLGTPQMQYDPATHLEKPRRRVSFRKRRRPF